MTMDKSPIRTGQELHVEKRALEEGIVVGTCSLH
jgi:hypothetical protein